MNVTDDARLKMSEGYRLIVSETGHGTHERDALVEMDSCGNRQGPDYNRYGRHQRSARTAPPHSPLNLVLGLNRHNRPYLLPPLGDLFVLLLDEQMDRVNPERLLQGCHKIRALLGIAQTQLIRTLADGPALRARRRRFIHGDH